MAISPISEVEEMCRNPVVLLQSKYIENTQT